MQLDEAKRLYLNLKQAIRNGEDPIYIHINLESLNNPYIMFKPNVENSTFTYRATLQNILADEDITLPQSKENFILQQRQCNEFYQRLKPLSDDTQAKTYIFELQDDQRNLNAFILNNFQIWYLLTQRNQGFNRNDSHDKLENELYSLKQKINQINLYLESTQSDPVFNGYDQNFLTGMKISFK